MADSRRNGTFINTPFVRLDTKTYLRLPRERNRPETRTGGRGLRRRFFYGHTPHRLAPTTPLCYNQSKKGEINMDGENRRKTLLDLLAAAEEPLSGSALAKKLGVSRQVIVQDIALLRATNRDILSTARGYLLYTPHSTRRNRCFMVSHTTEQIADELNTIVDLGGKVLDVIVTHPIYGSITVNLIISSRRDVQEFVHKIETKQTKPLKELTDDIHYHTVEAESEEVLDSIEKALAEKKYLLS